MISLIAKRSVSGEALFASTVDALTYGTRLIEHHNQTNLAHYGSTQK